MTTRTRRRSRMPTTWVAAGLALLLIGTLGSARSAAASDAPALLTLTPAQAADNLALAPLPQAFPVLADSFDSKDLAAGRWLAANATVGVPGADPADPSDSGVRLTSTGSGSYLYWAGGTVVDPNRRYWSARVRFKVESHASHQTVSLLSVKNALGTHNADLFTDVSTGRCRVDLLATATATSSTRCDDGAWHLVELRGDYGSGSYTLDWRLDGIDQPSVTSAGQPPTTVKSFWLGDPTGGKASVTDVDDAALSVSALASPPFLGPDPF